MTKDDKSVDKMRVWARITKAEAERTKDGVVTGIELNILFDDVIANKNILEIHFTYSAWYRPDRGHVELKGVLLMEMESDDTEKIASAWQKDKKMEEKLLTSIMHNINYKCSTEAILVTKLVDLPSPLVPPRIGMPKKSTPVPPPMGAA
ncbi:MAG: hypothetical protein AB1546_00025 [bacterium]